MNKNQIGVIGMGTMGAALARNLASRGFKVGIYNRSSEKTKAVLQKTAENNENKLHADYEIESFIENLEKPRKILLMVKAGKATDAVINTILPFLDENDIIIDGGNSFWEATNRRQAYLAEKNIHFVGMGVSGGEEGALKGPSLMPGGKKEAYAQIKPFVEAIAAKDFENGACVTLLGDQGSGHFVKMVHNGIEYAIMQLMAECFVLLKDGLGLETPEIHQFFAEVNKNTYESYLFELGADVLTRKDGFKDGFVIENVLDTAGQKGTGRWTVIEGLKRGVDVSLLDAAVLARVASSAKKGRIQLNKTYNIQKKALNMPKSMIKSALKQALQAGTMLAFMQGFYLLKETATDENWQYDFAEICRIWQGGCIIRIKLLEDFQKMFKNDPQFEKTNLWEERFVKITIQNGILPLQKLIFHAQDAFIATPCMTATLQSVLLHTEVVSGAQFIQVLRDGFGRHGFRRTDMEGDFHLDSK